MSKENVIKNDVKISRHCELNRFVDRVSTRMKHSSGLAIHENVEIFAVNPELQVSKDSPILSSRKSEFYVKAKNEYKNRGKPDPQIQRNIDAKNAEKERQRKILEKYKKEMMKGGYQICYFENVSDAPDPKLIAMRRHLYLVGSLPSSYQFE